MAWRIELGKRLLAIKNDVRASILVGVLVLGCVFSPQQATPAALPEVPGYRMKGASNPVVVITEYSDFQCPSCSKAQAYLLEMVEKHESEVTVVFRHYPLRMHRWAFLAALASECAGAQGKFWEYLKILFERQDEWDKSENARDLFLKYAGSLRLDVERFSRELDEGRWAGMVQRDLEDAKTKNVNATPTFFINDRRLVGGNQLRQYGEKFLEMEKTR